MSEPNPWQPMTDMKDLKVLGKLLEELGEATAAASRCLIQGIDEADPKNGKINRKWLEEELADVFAIASVVRGHFKLDKTCLAHRMYKKISFHCKWLRMSDEPTKEVP